MDRTIYEQDEEAFQGCLNRVIAEHDAAQLARPSGERQWFFATRVERACFQRPEETL